MSNDKGNNKPDAPKGTVKPPIVRLDAGRQTHFSKDGKSASIKNREGVTNSKPPGKREK